MNTLFLTWGTVYFIVAEVFAFLIRRFTGKTPHTQLWLLAIIVIGYIGLTVVAALAGLPVQNVIELVIGFIVVAAVSLGIVICSPDTTRAWRRRTRASRISRIVAVVV
jgi:hypothetical protein